MTQPTAIIKAAIEKALAAAIQSNHRSCAGKGGGEMNIPMQTCPECGYKMEATTDVFGNARPRAGDYSMCLSCGAISIFAKDLLMRKPTAEERNEISMNPDVFQAQLVRANLIGDKIKDRLIKG